MNGKITIYDGLLGEGIVCLLLDGITAFTVNPIADVFDALSEDRCYRVALPHETCFEIIQEGSGQDFDPILVEIFMDLKQEVQRIKEGCGQR